MNRKTIAAIGAVALAAALPVSACSRTSDSATSQAPSTSAPTAATAAAGQTTTGGASGVVLPVASNPINNDATATTLQVPFAGVEDLVDPATGKAISDRLMLTLKNTGTTPLTGLEVYYTMTDVITGASEAYYQALDGVTVAPGKETTVYFDNQTGTGHFPENQFSIFRSSTNEVDFAIEVSATGAKIANATAIKAKGTGEKVD